LGSADVHLTIFSMQPVLMPDGS